jgi:hypothetical protein
VQGTPKPEIPHPAAVPALNLQQFIPVKKLTKDLSSRSSGYKEFSFSFGI